jgi:hypothetical protein
MDLFDRNWATGELPFTHEVDPDTLPYTHPDPGTEDVNEVQRLLTEPPTPDKASDRTEEFHQQNFDDQKLEDLRKEMEERNRRLEEEKRLEESGNRTEPTSPSEGSNLLGGPSAPLPPSAAYGWLVGGSAALMAIGGLGALGYSVAEIKQLQDQAVSLPPDASFPLPPPGKVPIGPPVGVAYGVNPLLFYHQLRHRRRRPFGFM